MYRKTFISISGFLFLLLAQNSYADRGDSYFGIDMVNWTYTQSGNSGGATGIRGVFGRTLNKNLGWEVQLATGGSQSIPPYGTVQMNALGGAYFRMNLPLGKASLHGLLGYGSGSFSNAVSWTFQSGVSYGFGGEINMSDKLSLRADYMQNVSSSNWEAKSITFGAHFYF